MRNKCNLYYEDDSFTHASPVWGPTGIIWGLPVVSDGHIPLPSPTLA